MKPIQSILFLILALNLLGGSSLWFGYTIMRGAKIEEADLRKQLITENQTSDQLAGLRRVLTSTKEDRNELSQFLYTTSDEDQIKFISSIEKMGTSTSGAIVDTTLLELSKTKSPVLRGEFTISGTWRQLFHLLRLVEEAPSRIVVNRFEARNGTNDTWSGVIKIELISLRDAI